MNLFQDLLKYKLVKLYDIKKARKDNRLNLGHDYKDTLMNDNVSSHIQRNDTMFTFLSFINDYLYNTISAVRYLKVYKNFTVKKDDKRIR